MGINVDMMAVTAIAVITVGLVQLLKTLVPGAADGIVAAWCTVVVGTIVSCVYMFAPAAWPTFCTITCAVSGATLFYDIFYKTFERIFKAAGGEGH